MRANPHPFGAEVPDSCWQQLILCFAQALRPRSHSQSLCTQTACHTMAAPTPEEQTALASLESELRAILLSNKVSFAVAKAMVDLGATTIGEFWELYDNRDKLRRKAPTDLGHAVVDPSQAAPVESVRICLTNGRLHQA